MKQLILSGLFICIGIIAGSAGTYLFFANTANRNKTYTEERLRSGKYTSPLLECSLNKPLTADKLVKLENRIKQIVDASDKRVSVYFRDLNNGGIIEIENDEVFYPASLMKLPTALTVLKKSESDPDLLTKKINSTIGSELDQNIITGQLTQENKQNTVNYFLQQAIIFSDNKANSTLMKFIGISSIQNTLKELGVPEITDIFDYKINPRIYSRFLRMLYNASYLNHANSELLLSYLAQSKYNDGIKKGLPGNIVVAHKFGERVVEEVIHNTYQLHDCGIIYTKNPYILCVMTEGNNFQELSNVIASISAESYKTMK